MVKFTNCVDKDNLGYQIQLNKGHVLAVDASVDGNVASTQTLPLPGGKHDGVMDLFFAMMYCDPGTFGTTYVCRQATCVPTFPGHSSDKHTTRPFVMMTPLVSESGQLVTA